MNRKDRGMILRLRLTAAACVALLAALPCRKVRVQTNSPRVSAVKSNASSGNI